MTRRDSTFVHLEENHDVEDESSGLEVDETQQGEMQRIFGSTLPQYLQPVREMVQQVVGGNADAETLLALQSTVGSLGQAAGRMGFGEIEDILSSLGDRLTGCPAGEAPSRDLREAVLGDLIDLSDLAERMARASHPPPSRSPTLFSALEGFDSEAVTKLSAAGVMTVEQLLTGRVDELSAVSGLTLQRIQNLQNRLSGVGERDAEPNTADSPPGDPLALARQQEAEAEAAVQESRSNVQELRALLSTQSEELQSIRRMSEQLAKVLDHTDRALLPRIETLRQLRGEKDKLIKICESTESRLHRRIDEALELRETKNRLSQERLRFEEELESLTNQVDRVRRAMAKSSQRGRTKS